MVQLFLDHGVDVEVVRNERNRAIHDAAANGHFSLLKMLAAKGANINAENFEGLTPLLISVHIGHLEAVKWLVDHVTRSLSNPNGFQGATQASKARKLADSLNEPEMIAYFHQLD